MYVSPACSPSASGSQPRKWSNERFSIMNTMTCSMPEAAGSGNRSPSCVRCGATIERSLHPSAMPPAAVALVVRNLRREMSDIESSFGCIVHTGCRGGCSRRVTHESGRRFCPVTAGNVAALPHVCRGKGVAASGRGRMRAKRAAALHPRGVGGAREHVIIHGHDHRDEDHGVVEQVQLESRDPQLQDAGGSSGSEQRPAGDDLPLKQPVLDVMPELDHQRREPPQARPPTKPGNKVQMPTSMIRAYP